MTLVTAAGLIFLAGLIAGYGLRHIISVRRHQRSRVYIHYR